MAEHRRYEVTDDRFGRLALTQAEVADALDVSERSIRQWETGMAFPSADNLKKLIAVYLHRGAQ